MIKIEKKSDCCGCTACQQMCQHGCITMKEDFEGFLYPVVSARHCTDCGLCEKVCPVINRNEERYPLSAHAVIANDEEVRRESSSGGAFTLLAEKVIDDGGIVFGAAFDEDWNVRHTAVETKAGLQLLRGSKYVQSCMGDVFSAVKQQVKSGRRVLFCGTPCQVAGLQNYLRREYENLITADFVCHGVPSPKMWQWYIRNRKKEGITDISFRDKRGGWKDYYFVVKTQRDEEACVHREHPYMMPFLENQNMRPSCYQCPAKAGRSGSDITLADFWNVHRVIDGFDDNMGTSLLMANTRKGEAAMAAISNGCRCETVDFQKVLPFNMSWKNSYAEHRYRRTFFALYKYHRKDFTRLLLRKYINKMDKIRFFFVKKFLED